jgi:NTE family protein
MRESMKRGLCFSGGGIKIFAHIGALKAIEEENLKFDMVGGTSAGSIMAILYALGYSSDEMYEKVEKYGKKMRYVDIEKILKIISGLLFQGKIIVDGLNTGRVLTKAIKQICKDNNIENMKQLKMPVVIPAVNLQNGEVIVFSSKEVRKNISDETIYVTDAPIDVAVRSSCSYPGVFSPCMYKKSQFVDGGVRENLPWKELKAVGADTVLGIHFGPIAEKTEYYDNMIEIAVRSMSLMERELSNYEISGIDNLITVRTKKVGLLELDAAKYLYKRGYEDTKIFLKNKYIDAKNN